MDNAHQEILEKVKDIVAERLDLSSLPENVGFLGEGPYIVEGRVAVNVAYDEWGTPVGGVILPADGNRLVPAGPAGERDWPEIIYYEVAHLHVGD